MSVHELRHQSTIKEPVHELRSADIRKCGLPGKIGWNATQDSLAAAVVTRSLETAGIDYWRIVGRRRSALAA